MNAKHAASPAAAAYAAHANANSSLIVSEFGSDPISRLIISETRSILRQHCLR